MFQNVLMTTLTPLCDKSEVQNWENHPFIGKWPENGQYKSIKDTNLTKTIKKKKKRSRTAYTTEQLRVLERTFTRSKYIDTERRKELAESLQVAEICIKVWFQNRRMKEKKASSESSDSSSECCNESVTPPPQNVQSSEEYIPNCNYEINQPNQRGCYFLPQANHTLQYNQDYYQNCEPMSFVNYNSHLQPNEFPQYSQNGTSFYPAVYYSTEYTSLENNQNNSDKAYNWSNGFDVNYF